MTLQPGQTLRDGQYRIERVLGEGGFGVTYLALNQALNQWVVIKTPNDKLRQDPNYSAFEQRFIQEARDLAKLSNQRHPHIVQVFDLFEDERLRLSCLVMEFIEGIDLLEIVKRQGALPEAEALRYIRQIGDALSVVHQVGLLHRDIKPANIMVRSGTKDAMLIDFGLAREFAPNVPMSHTPMGTPGYAPLEQYDRRAKRGPFTDVYALAATLYTLVTVEAPVDASGRAAGNQLRGNDPLESPQRLNRHLTTQTSQAILKGMALLPEDRPQTMREWLAFRSVESRYKTLHFRVRESYKRFWKQIVAPMDERTATAEF